MRNPFKVLNSCTAFHGMSICGGHFIEPFWRVYVLQYINSPGYHKSLFIPYTVISSALPVMAQTQPQCPHQQFQPHQVLIPTQHMTMLAPPSQNPSTVAPQSTPPTSINENQFSDPLNVGGLQTEDTLSYGQTTTDCFHEERKLLEQV